MENSFMPVGQVVTNQQMSKMVTQLEVFSYFQANKDADLSALCFNDYINDGDVDFPFEVDADILSGVGYAWVQYELDKKIRQCLDCYFIKYHDLELYYNDDDLDFCFTQPYVDLQLTGQQYEFLQDVCREQYILGLEDVIGSGDWMNEVHEWTFEYLENKK